MKQNTLLDDQMLSVISATPQTKVYELYLEEKIQYHAICFKLKVCSVIYKTKLVSKFLRVYSGVPWNLFPLVNFVQHVKSSNVYIYIK
jgi:hypothetical protein